MSDPYRLTIYVDGCIDRMLPFDSPNVETALAFADRQRYGRHAELSDVHGTVRRFPDDALRNLAARLRPPGRTGSL
jgi:hypothetical protein